MNVARATVAQMRMRFKQFVFQSLIYFQQDGAPPLWSFIVKDYLQEIFSKEGRS